MRDYGKVAPTFWTGETGLRLRGLGRDAQLVALYLLTCPESTMYGIYHLSLPTICHHLGWTGPRALEGASKALASLSQGGFAYYDAASEQVFVPEMARFQVSDTLTPKDKRHKGAIRELRNLRKSVFFKEFMERYRVPWMLPDAASIEGACKPLRRGGDDPVLPLRSQEQEQDQEQEQEQDTPQPPANGGLAVAFPIELNTQEFREAWSRWERHRREIKKPLKQTQADAQLRQFAAWGEAKAIAAIDYTILKGWIGIREPDQPFGTNGHAVESFGEKLARINAEKEARHGQS